MPATLPAVWAIRLLSRTFSGERAFGFAGCAMACASGSFALYMAVLGPSAANRGGSHDFTVFAQLAGRGREAHRPEEPPSVSPADIDPVVTGSIPGHATRSGAGAAAAGKLVLANIVLRQVEGDSALIEMNDRLMVTKVGDLIPGGGRFLALTQRDGRPALETSTGLIVEVR